MLFLLEIISNQRFLVGLLYCHPVIFDSSTSSGRSGAPNTLAKCGYSTGYRCLATIRCDLFCHVVLFEGAPLTGMRARGNSNVIRRWDQDVTPIISPPEGDGGASVQSPCARETFESEACAWDRDGSYCRRTRIDSTGCRFFPGSSSRPSLREPVGGKLGGVETPKAADPR